MSQQRSTPHDQPAQEQTDTQHSSRSQSRFWLHVARKDFADAVRSRLFWALSALMLLLAYVGMAVPELQVRYGGAESAAAADGVDILSDVMGILIPIIGLIVGYMAIVGERETGSIRMMLSLPLKRSEALLGKFVGRVGVVAVPIILGFALAAPFVVALYGSFPVDTYVGYVGRVVTTGIIYIAIAVGVSGSVAARGTALAFVVGIFAVFEFFWSFLLSGLYFLLNGNLDVSAGDLPTWYEAMLQLQPMSAVDNAFHGFTGISTAEPLLLQEWVSALLVLAWILVPLAIGYRRFRAADIS
ncbi:MAG: ABC-type transport system involved in multi-copper enzyme maturation, permease component [halophilic archaeon J07HX5]|jgi:ABC-type transport system involved in multi-copper enzyme maturation, permease component|nr:MAG: ABC-type transport system involved in multi-copper enzyme maturation, permease component [halophilic archaeon J07HX5]